MCVADLRFGRPPRGGETVGRRQVGDVGPDEWVDAVEHVRTVRTGGVAVVPMPFPPREQFVRPVPNDWHVRPDAK
jgi:hypothetical protein